MLRSASACWRSLLALPMLLIVMPTLALAQQQASEPELKAAILVNMLLFVDWPAQGVQARDQLTVCYRDVGPVASALEQLDGKLLKGKSLRVLRVDAAQVAGCHALYVSPLEASAMAKPATEPGGGGVLLVGDSPGALQRGVMLNLEVAGGRIVFDIDLRAVRQAGLTVSSKALRLARQVLEP